MKLKHGLHNHRLYQRWRNMVRRCHDPSDVAWKNYGGRGVTVCERWHDVANFVADMDASYAPGLTVERRDNSLGYSPENCCWADRIQQGQNRRTVILVTINGVTKPAVAWGRENGIRKWVVWYRIKQLGWDPVEAVTRPLLTQHEISSRATVVAAAQRTAAAKARRG